MGDILSLSKHRKARAKAQREARASENRVKYGRTKIEKAADKAQKDKSEHAVDGAKIDSSSKDEGDDV